MIFTRSYHKVLGGMEKQIGSICKILTSLGHEVHLVSLDVEKPEPFFQNSSFVSMTTISSTDPNQPTKFTERLNRQKRLIVYLNKLKPDVGIAFMTGSYFYSRIPTFLAGVPLILAERNSPQIYKLTSARNFSWIYFASMIFASRIIVQFTRYKQGYPRFLHRKITSIPNEVLKTSFQKQTKTTRNSFYYAGRLSFQKQIDKLILGFVKFHENYPETKLLIIGEGEERIQLQKMITENNATNYISIIGPIEDLGAMSVKWDVLCLMSIWEGFPNVLAESLANGIPAVGFSNADGVSDLIVDNFNGWLTIDDGTPDAILKLLTRTQLGRDNVNSENCIGSVKKFDTESIRDEWEKLLTAYRA